MKCLCRVLFGVFLAVISLPVWAGLLSQRTLVLDYAGAHQGYAFGSTGVVISDDGMKFVTASPGFIPDPTWNDGTGSAYLFQYLNGRWSANSGNLSGPTAATAYGTGLALSADGSEMVFGFGVSCTPFMGMPPVLPCNPVSVSLTGTGFTNGVVNGLNKIFNDPTNTPGFNSNFGTALALSKDGRTIIIGASGAEVGSADYAGHALIYTYDAGSSTWNLAADLADPATTPASGDLFGTAVALSADGKTALVSSPSGTSGPSVYMYKLGSSTWGLTETFPGYALAVLGVSNTLALSADGNTAIVSSPTGADVYRAAASWVPDVITLPNAGGSGSVAISADGSSILVGTDKTVYQYTFSSGSWASTQSFTDPAATGFDGFGTNGVALSADKETMVVTMGSATVNTYTDAGALYVYQSPADLSAAISASATQVALNQQVTLDLTVTNNDAAVTAYDVSFAGTLPAGLTFVSASAAGGTCSTSDQTVTCTLPSLAPGAVWQPGLTVEVTTAGTYSNTVTVTSNQPDPDTSNNSASVTLNMLPPTVSNGAVSTNAGVAVSGTLSGHNPCGCGAWVFSIVSNPAHGTVKITDAATGAFTYTPDAGFIGSDSFTFQLTNGVDTSGTATESITVKDVPPTANDGSVSTDINQPASGTLSATPGYAGQALSYTIVTQPKHGKVTLTTTSGVFTYTPDNGYAGSDSFTFTAGDGIVLSAAATVSVTVKDVAPTANNGSVSTTEGQAVSATLSATPGYSGQALKFDIATQPAHGGITLDSTSGAFTYTPASGYSGSDSFTFTVGDGTQTSAAATESITIKSAGGGKGGGGGGFGLAGLGLLAGLLGFVRRRRKS